MRMWHSSKPQPRTAARLLRPEINVTPLVDVVLVLLIIFMVIAPRLEAGERVELPGISHVDDKAKLESVVLTVTQSGRYLLEKDLVPEDRLAAELRQSHQQSPQRRLVLKADRAVPYGKMRDLFAQAQEIGFPGVALMVDETVNKRTR
jgi:biopolymer transport protein ExbD/biopolymer transport protein TolR